MTLVVDCLNGSVMYRLRQGLRALSVVCCLLLFGCSESPPTLYQLHGETMGTTWSVKMTGLPLAADIDSTRADIEVLLASINTQMSTYQEDSLISRYNHAEVGSWHPLPADFWRVLRYSLSLAELTGGAFDPTIGPLVNLWGFGPESVDGPPDSAAQQAALARVGWQRVRLDSSQRAVQQPGELYLDLSATAKGYAVDKVSDWLAQRGVPAALVEIGGELRAFGVKADGQPWRVAIEAAAVGRREVAEVISLTDMAVATSGDYRNFHLQQGRRRSHLIDPRRGEPVTHGIVSVTVLDAECLVADGLATAFSVLDPDEGLALATAEDLAVRWVIADEQGELMTQLSPKFAGYLAANAANE